MQEKIFRVDEEKFENNHRVLKNVINLVFSLDLLVKG